MRLLLLRLGIMGKLMNNLFKLKCQCLLGCSGTMLVSETTDTYCVLFHDLFKEFCVLFFDEFLRLGRQDPWNDNARRWSTPCADIA